MKWKFDKYIKLEAVKLLLEQKRLAAAVAKEIGVHENTLRKWIYLYRYHQEDSFPG